MTAVKRVPVVEGVFAETPRGPRLVGSRCATCGTVYFPRAEECRKPGCRSGKVEEALLGPRGTLWSYTVQYYKPPPPARLDEPFTPYAVGMVDLPEGIRVLAMISAADPRALNVGMEVELVLETLHHDGEGNEVITWKFRPAGNPGGAQA